MFQILHLLFRRLTSGFYITFLYIFCFPCQILRMPGGALLNVLYTMYYILRTHVIYIYIYIRKQQFLTFMDFGRLCFRTSFSDNLFSLNTIIVIIRVGSRILAGSLVEFFFILVNNFSCHKELFLRSCGTPGSSSVWHDYTLGETSITCFCSDYVIKLFIMYFYASF